MRSILLFVVLSAVVTGCKSDDLDDDGVPDDVDCAPEDAAYSEERTWQIDRDGDGYGIPTVSCEPPEEVTDLSGDCNDNDGAVFPGADEVCDERDQDCDAEIDEAAVDAVFWSRDSDQDGYGSITGGIEVCEPPFGYVSESGDCSDSDDTIFPGADEVCDGVDEDCDGVVDDEPIGAPRWYRDADADDYGDAADFVNECQPPDGFASASGDCDDGDPWLHPGAIEYCNGYDDDCDGLFDKDDPDEAGDATWYVDDDGDGWGTREETTTACARPDGFARIDLDCDDTRPAVNPDASEVCLNGLDDDCDGAAPACGEDVETALVDDSYASWTGPGDYAYLGKGANISAIGDWTGDGFAELALGAQGADGFAGGVYFAVGGASAAGSVNDGLALKGAVAGDYAGFALAPAGDADGDGVPDVLISAPGANGAAGAAYLVHGPVTESGLLATAAGATLSGPAGSQAGYAVASAGDQDGDGRLDLLVGANFAESAAGRVYLVTATVSGAVDLETGAIATVTGAAGEGLGWSASSGDTDGDGLAEVAVGGSFDVDGSGRAYLFEGPLEADVAAADGVAIRSEQPGSRAGQALDLRGDYDGDGYADLLVAAAGWDDTSLDSGRIYVVSGPVDEDVDLADADAIFDGAIGAQCGTTASWVGSPNGDGLDDFAVGCPWAWDSALARGAVALVEGGFAPGQYAIAKKSRGWAGTVDFDFVGGGVGPAGDQDGDGIDDLLISASQDSTGGITAGKVYVVLGASGF